ncbi:unnamed protein product [Vitrella brassicaformis CCMP3155]|uniref:Uncharacterized protein n=1 Tax=Vitrella brassicaformis (strain CCMP3155) TaxID=1169540 RepID=A0A0G4GW54_VITBC|nr:unnamed protein product [Vitrella brassicaformis CCMP3155]|eukprot:CEM35192.1 unnamed protein product [Vitrella brassicaformis CCMP3155]
MELLCSRRPVPALRSCLPLFHLPVPAPPPFSRAGSGTQNLQQFPPHIKRRGRDTKAPKTIKNSYGPMPIDAAGSQEEKKQMAVKEWLQRQASVLSGLPPDLQQSRLPGVIDSYKRRLLDAYGVGFLRHEWPMLRLIATRKLLHGKL